MSRLNINIGSTANDKTGDPLRTAFTKVNTNFTELYAMLAEQSAGTVYIDAVPPSVPIANQLWFDSTEGKLYLRYSDTWVDTSPPATGTSDRLVNGSYQLVVSSTGHTTMPGGIVFDNGRDIYNPTNNGVNIWDGPETGPYNGELLLDSDGVKIFTNNEAHFWSFANDGTFNLPLITDSSGIIQTTGHIKINANGKIWKFDLDGMLRLPAGGIIVDSNGTNILDGLGGGGTPTLLQNGYASASLEVNNAAIDFINDGVTYGTVGQSTNDFKVAGGLDLYLSSNARVSAKNWKFDRDGNIHLPVSGDIVDSNGTSIIDRITTGGKTLSIDTNGVLAFPNGNILDTGGPAFKIQSQNSITVSPNGNNFVFGTNGNLTLPAGGVIKNSDGSTYGGGSGTVNWADIGNINNNYGPQKLAVGLNAGNISQGNNGTALGYYAGHDTQGNGAVAIGWSAGQISQGDYSIAIGTYAGQSNQDANSILLNATGSAVNTTGSGLFIKPVRQVTGGAVPSGFYPTYYNPTTGEVIVVTP